MTRRLRRRRSERFLRLVNALRGSDSLGSRDPDRRRNDCLQRDGCDRVSRVATEFLKHPDGHVDRAFARKWSATALRRSEEHTSELQSLMRISYAVFCLKKKNQNRHMSISKDIMMKIYT